MIYDVTGVPLHSEKPSDTLAMRSSRFFQVRRKEMVVLSEAGKEVS